MEFAKALSGHDKNRYYLVLKEDDDGFLLVNGTTRPLEKAKKKNKKHVQLIKRLPKEVAAILEEGESNLIIKRAVREYEKLMNHKQEEK